MRNQICLGPRGGTGLKRVAVRDQGPGWWRATKSRKEQQVGTNGSVNLRGLHWTCNQAEWVKPSLGGISCRCKNVCGGMGQGVGIGLRYYHRSKARARTFSPLHHVFPATWQEGVLFITSVFLAPKHTTHTTEHVLNKWVFLYVVQLPKWKNSFLIR